MIDLEDLTYEEVFELIKTNQLTIEQFENWLLYVSSLND